jgi:hypothetical protein
VVDDMMRKRRLEVCASGKKKTALASGRSSSSGAFLFAAADRDAHPGPCPKPPWPLPARLAEPPQAGFIPDAGRNVAQRPAPRQPKMCHKHGCAPHEGRSPSIE